MTTLLRLGPNDHGRPVSSQEFAEAEFAEPWKYEREGGRLIVLAPDGYEHQATAEPWRDYLVWYKRDHPGVIERVFSSPWIPIDGEKDRIGDIGVYLSPCDLIPAGKQPLPDLIIEIVSPGRHASARGYLEKRRVYDRIGIREYVIVDRFARSVTVLRRTPGGFEERTLSTGDTYSTPLLPGLAIPLSEVF